jgi:beta-1,4-mannosyltransferase
MDDADGIVVLNSVAAPRPTTNPYNVMLIAAVRSQPATQLLDFSWPVALFGRYDAVHAHWPETRIGGRPPMRAIRAVLFAAWIARLQSTRTAVVRTQHNLDEPQGLTRFEAGLLKRFQALTTEYIVLNPHTALPTTAPSTVIPHGHYRDWYRDSSREERVAGRVVYFGMIRRYKGVEALIDAFRGMPPDGDPALALVVAGRPSSPDHVEALRRRAGDDHRIDLRFGYLETDELVRLTTSAELVVLPYRHMHNSGAILAALSLDTPVLAPDNDVTRALADEVGSGWVHRFTGDLSSHDLAAALRAVRTRPPHPVPDLSAREWNEAGARHVEVFRSAIRRKRGDA